jgi:oligoendopeptidase F
MESPKARELRLAATEIENSLGESRNSLALGISITNDRGESIFEEMSSVALRSRMRVDGNEDVRRSCWNGLRGIGEFALSNGFVELVKHRNAMARELGYPDFYDYKVTQAEGFGKSTLFEMLDELERDTRPLLEYARSRLAEEKGNAALAPWNSGFMMAGEVTVKLDPYFPFERSVETWGRSFAALGISYRGASMDLDLLDRKRKYSNGFCHWPQVAWRKTDGTFQPSTAHFTSLADPSAVGSGFTALTTLMHEAGHAAHFANICQPSPLFAQERAPTSVRPVLWGNERSFGGWERLRSRAGAKPAACRRYGTNFVAFAYRLVIYLGLG